MESGKFRDLIELRSEWAARPDDLLKFLNKYKPHIVHFTGHGTTAGEIVLEDENTHVPEVVSTAAMRELFKTLKGNIRLVVLNACYSRTQALAIVENIDCAVGMSAEIKDNAAIVFVASFYRALAFGLSVEEAFEQGKLAIMLKGLPGDKTPDLVCGAGIDASKIFLVAPLPQPPPSFYGLTFKKVVWKHHYLANNGDFRGEVEFFAENTSNNNVVRLPPHHAGWFGINMEKPDVKTEIYGEEKNAYIIMQSGFSESKEIRTDFDGRKRAGTFYGWEFNIGPPLPPQKSLHYGVIAETKGTELEAFTANGSFAGMATPYRVGEMTCEVYSPEGYKFKEKTHFVKDYAGIMKDFTGGPEFMNNDTKIIWSVKNPDPNLQYLIKVVLVKAN
jgi:hypothetical protein